MNNVLNEYLSKWIAKANEDIFTVKQLLKENPEPQNPKTPKPQNPY